MEFAVRANEAPNLRQSSTTGVRNSLTSQKRHAVGPGASRHGGCFHVYCLGPISCTELGFLVDIGNLGKTDQNTLANSTIGAAPVAGIDYVSRGKGVSNLKSRIQSPGKPGRNHECRMVKANYGLAGAPRCLGPNASANHSYAVLFIELEFATVESF